MAHELTIATICPKAIFVQHSSLHCIKLFFKISKDIAKGAINTHPAALPEYIADAEQVRRHALDLWCECVTGSICCEGYMKSR